MRALERWCDAVGDDETMIRLIEAQARADVSEDARRIRCPALVVHSQRDPRIPFDEGRRLAGIIPGAEFLPLDGEKTWPLPSDRSFGTAAEAIEHFLRSAESLRASNGFAPELTPREREVLELIARGLDNLQIAAQLGLSEKTVRNHVTPIFSKLCVENRSQAIVRARDAGLGSARR
jgi:DNA-binding CsgD family transcriptional regulator